MEKIFSAITSFFLLFATTAATIKPNIAPILIRQKSICIDAGHGGADPGAIHTDLSEKEVNLNIAKRLGTLLTANNYKVVMTRTDNNSSNLTNSERAAACNSKKSDVLVSIHLNSSEDATLNYSQGLYGVGPKDKAFTDILQQTVEEELKLTARSKDATTDFADNLLLKAKMPATLQETVFLSSEEEYIVLKTGERQQQIANALYDGIKKWFAQK